MDKYNKKEQTYIELDLIEFINFTKTRLFYVFLITSIFAIGSVIYSLSLPNKYTSSAKFEVVQKADQNSLSSSLGQVSGLISGIGLPSPTSDRSSLIIGIVQSREFFRLINSENNLIPSIMAAQNFDFSNKTIIYNEKKYDPILNLWTRKPPAGRSVTPTYLEAYLDYRKIVNISQNKKDGFITISVEHVSPIFAKGLVDIIWNDLNKVIRDNDMKESTEALDYLNNELIMTTQSDIRQSINSLISLKLETQMLTKIKKDYALDPIDYPYIPEIKSSPRRSIICIIGTIIGLIVSIAILVIQYMYRKI
tara:strand:+ start:4128 stop:5051 length:924 start_codon:yes stop_codon:yes gene_type:complete